MPPINESEAYPHLPVLYHEIIHALHPYSPGHFVDATVGAGGHAWGILTACEPDGMLLGLDLDPQALAIAHQRLSVFRERAILVQSSFTNLSVQLKRIGWQSVQGILLDLGLSSMQLDTPERGFSFQTQGPLDMRFDPLLAKSAADLVNQMPETELANLIWQLGEEPQSRRIARAICQARPLHTTQELTEVILRAVGSKKGRLHPATRTFQALRMSVNGELQAIQTVLPQTVEALAPGGRLAIISFHSLEDRLVKQYFRQESRDCICPPQQPICTCQHHASLVEINRHPITAGDEETQQNPRARSAKLRVAEKVELA